jgi:hypothetical protein
MSWQVGSIRFDLHLVEGVLAGWRCPVLDAGPCEPLNLLCSMTAMSCIVGIACDTFRFQDTPARRCMSNGQLHLQHLGSVRSPNGRAASATYLTVSITGTDALVRFVRRMKWVTRSGSGGTRFTAMQGCAALTACAACGRSQAEHRACGARLLGVISGC